MSTKTSDSDHFSGINKIDVLICENIIVAIVFCMHHKMGYGK